MRIILWLGALAIASAQAASFTLESTEIEPNSMIDKKFEANTFGCSGENKSPALKWSGAPKDTKSFVVTVYDPDAPTGSGFWHWFVYNIPANVTELPANAGAQGGANLPKGAAMNRIDYGFAAWGGVCPPEGDKPHRYIFTIYALKTDKLDDLAGMIGRGTVEMVFAGGSLAMALKKAAAELDGKQFSLGNAENPANSDKPFFVSRERIEQAKRMISEGRAKGIEFVLPIDFVLQDSRISETIGPDDQQFDVGPKTIDLFDRKVGEFISKHRGGQAVAFYNGVLGMFEDQRFEMGTRRFIEQLKRLKQQGVEVYVGGGEGLAALERYGHPSDVTHCFTAGGTVLNALGSEPVPYLVALSMAAQRIRRG
jgi:Raf kinase inhibitor-like YbhB/YbcL family protein